MSDKNELELIEIEKDLFVTRKEAVRLKRLKPRRPLFPPGTVEHAIHVIGVGLFIALVAPLVHRVTDPVVHSLFQAVGVSSSKHPPTSRP